MRTVEDATTRGDQQEMGVSICEGMTGRERVMDLKRLVVSRMEEEKKKLKKQK